MNKQEAQKEIDKIFSEHWNLKDVKCKSATCVWIDGNKVKERLIELLNKAMYNGN